MTEKPLASLIFSILSGVFILLNAAIFILAYAFLPDFPWYPPAYFMLALAILGILCASLVLTGAYYLYKGRNTLGGTLVIVFSALSLLIGGGFIIGSLLGIIGGVLALSGL
ncbi:MAG: hypothetical protein QXU61_04520 [Archaeoglobaceae archaeon]